MALTDKLTSIAAAIREKGGTTEKLTLDAMPTAIANLPTGGGGEDKVPNPIILNGTLSHLFKEDKLKWLLEDYGDRIVLKDVTSMESTFSSCSYDKELKFVIEPAYSSTSVNLGYLFNNAKCIIPNDFFTQKASGKIGTISHMFEGYKGKETPPFITNTNSYNSSGYLFSRAECEKIGDITFAPDSFQQMFYSCYYLKEVPNMTLKGNRWQTYAYSYNNGCFAFCYSLRKIPQDFLKQLYNTAVSSSSYAAISQTFYYCYALDEVVGFSPKTKALTSNCFLNTFNNCYHLKRIVFDTQEDGTPYTAEWKNQTIELNRFVGWAGEAGADKSITGYNTGITYEKEVGTGKGSYAALKDDPDWWSREFMYSRFGHDAAVELINTLPDTSAYIKAQGASNNIVKFYTNAGMNTDGGSVSQLTEEEVAVAAAKGWTISYTG